eukprot:2985574-Rhodomonas_salina.4
MLDILNCHAKLHQLALCSRQCYDRLPSNLPKHCTWSDKQHMPTSRMPGDQTICITSVRESHDHADTSVVIIVTARWESKSQTPGVLQIHHNLLRSFDQQH